MTKSAKRFIRICLIFATFCTANIYFLPISAFSCFVIISFLKLSIKPFLLYALPWSITNTIWAFYCCGYVFLTLSITIICYYYKLRLHQLDIYAYWLSKQHFNHFNQGIMKLLKEYNEIITEVNQFDKFASKSIFFIFLFLVSTDVFFIYNVIYLNLNAVTLYGLFLGIFVFSFASLLIFFSAIIIPSQLLNNKRNLTKLFYKKNIQVKTAIKVFT